ncbi:unnamed protein product [Schistosoma mattheei]|uniref:Uncharacterized protein n=1 Tax=Schistosoma mattheei TaxID=31246 RepID=A0A3P8BIQ6_9TREM|nr:unnamed protein product [Schistosoma mattheei]
MYNVTLEPGSGQRISTLVDPVNGGLWKFLYSSDGLLTYLKNPQDSSYTQFHYAPESGRLLQITYPNAKSIDVARIVRSQIPVNMRFHTLDEVSNQDNTPKSDSTNTPDQLSTVIMIQTTDSNKHEMEIDYGDSNNLWKVLLAQVYQIRKDLYAPVQLVRQITIPGNSIRNAIEHTNVWTYHLNDQSNPRILDTHTSIGGGGYSDFGVNFDKKSQPYHFFKNHFRRSISAQNYLSGSDLHRSKRQMSHPFSKRFTARSIFNYNDKNYNNLGEEVDWHYQKTLTVNGQNLLNVNFNWALQLETYQHASTGHILLQVVYNANFQPMIFNASANYLQSTGAHEMFYPTKADYIRPATLILAYTK